MTKDEIVDGVAKRKWFHCIDLGDGIVTPGYRERDAWTTYRLPERLDGKRVLDIGAWEGGFSFESERRGASQVVAMDVWKREDEPGSGGFGWDNFQFAHEAIGSHVIPENRNVYELGRADLGQFDLVLFLEVLYHLQDPILGLRNVRRVLAPGGFVCLESWIDAEWIEPPAMIFYSGDELNKDPTNWWGPNLKCVELMAKAAGFQSAELVWWRPDGHFDGRGKRACFHLK